MTPNDPKKPRTLRADVTSPSMSPSISTRKAMTGDGLKAMRERHKLDQGSVAKICEISLRQYQRLEALGDKELTAMQTLAFTMLDQLLAQKER